MSIKYETKFDGLQIRWDYERELEKISRETLLKIGAESTVQITAANFIYPHESGAYQYTPVAQRIGNTFTFTYRKKDEPKCFAKNGWIMDVGYLKVEFLDDALTKLGQVRWHHADGTTFTPKKPKFQIIGREPIRGPKRKLVSVQAIQRNQTKFRSNILAYQNCICLITGDVQEEVLQAAHIIPVSEQGSDNATNGVLLRADIHILFDKNMVSVNDRNGKITWKSKVDSYMKPIVKNRYISTDILNRISKAMRIRNTKIRRIQKPI